MALASILYTDGSFKQVELDKALKAYQALTGLTEPTEAQAEWLCTIKRIFLPPSARPANYEAVYQYETLQPLRRPVRALDDENKPKQTSIVDPLTVFDAKEKFPDPAQIKAAEYNERYV